MYFNTTKPIGLGIQHIKTGSTYLVPQSVDCNKIHYILSSSFAIHQYTEAHGLFYWSIVLSSFLESTVSNLIFLFA